MLKLSYTKSGIGLLKNHLSSLSYYDGWTKIALHMPILDLGEQVPCAYPILDPKFSSKFKRWKKEVPKVSSNF